MSSSAYAKFYVFSKDSKFLRGKHKDINCDYMKSCINLQEWDEPFENLNFSLPKTAILDGKEINIDPQNVEQIGFISPELKIQNFVLNEDNESITVSSMFDYYSYKDYIKTTVSDNELKNGWKILKREVYQYNGIWVDYDILEDAINRYNKNLEENIKKLQKLEEVEFELKYKSQNFESILKELRDIKRLLTKNDEEQEEEDESSLERIGDDISFLKDDIEELKYKILACSRLMGTMDCVRDELRNDYTDSIYVWLYLC